jgi:hypothetical protein
MAWQLEWYLNFFEWHREDDDDDDDDDEAKEAEDDKGIMETFDSFHSEQEGTIGTPL